MQIYAIMREHLRCGGCGIAHGLAQNVNGGDVALRRVGLLETTAQCVEKFIDRLALELGLGTHQILDTMRKFAHLALVES